MGRRVALALVLLASLARAAETPYLHLPLTRDENVNAALAKIDDSFRSLGICRGADGLTHFNGAGGTCATSDNFIFDPTAGGQLTCGQPGGANDCRLRIIGTPANSDLGILFTENAGPIAVPPAGVVGLYPLGQRLWTVDASGGRVRLTGFRGTATPGRCLETDGSGDLVVAAGPCSVGATTTTASTTSATTSTASTTTSAGSTSTTTNPVIPTNWEASNTAMWSLDQSSGNRTAKAGNCPGTNCQLIPTGTPGADTTAGHFVEGTGGLSVSAASNQYVSCVLSSTCQNLRRDGAGALPNFSWGAYIYPTAVSVEQYWLDSTQTANGGFSAGLDATNHFFCEVCNATDCARALSTATASVNTLYSHVCTYTASTTTVTLYVNGESAGTVVHTETSSTSGTFSLSSSIPTRDFTGTIDEAFVDDSTWVAGSVCRECACGMNAVNRCRCNAGTPAVFASGLSGTGCSVNTECQDTDTPAALCNLTLSSCSGTQQTQCGGCDAASPGISACNRATP